MPNILNGVHLDATGTKIGSWIMIKNKIRKLSSIIQNHVHDAQKKWEEESKLNREIVKNSLRRCLPLE